MNYHFFDYKYNISGFHSDLFCTAHLIYILLVLLGAPLVSYLLRNAKSEKIKTALKILFFVVASLEIIKISWESYYDVTTGQGFNAGGILPFYTCSLFIFTLPFAVSGIPFSSSVRATATPPYFFIRGKTAAILSGLPFTEFIIALPL